MKFFRKYHKWLSIILTLFIILFALSGIVMNHRKFFSQVDVNRNLLPEEYRYKNWNNAAVAGLTEMSSNNILVYGNIGIWKTDSLFTSFSDFNMGFKNGVDNRKVSVILKTKKNELFAGTYFGLFHFSNESGKWIKVNIPVKNKRITDIIEQNDTLMVLTRSYLLKTKDYINFETITLPEPEEYKNKAGLFKTLWVIHSGEIWGTIGKLIVDFVGLIFIFLSVTGLIYFIAPGIIKRKKRKEKSIDRIKKTRRFSIKWHNKIGWTTLILLIITTATGMFLRPPLLIAIYKAQVNKIPGSSLDSPNPWDDKLRKIIYDSDANCYYLATIDGIFRCNSEFTHHLVPMKNQPPISVMGTNVFQKHSPASLLVGSFAGLYHWDINSGNYYNYITKMPVGSLDLKSQQFGAHNITAYYKQNSQYEIYFDYGSGACYINSTKEFIPMPSEIVNQYMSLWNVALEFHTARIYKFMFGDFYILFIPLIGLSILFILISGFIVWYKKHRK